MLNPVLLKAAQKVMLSVSPARFNIYPHFISATPGSTFSFRPFIVEEILIDRNYADNFADEIDLVMKVSPKDYALMQDMGQDLLCVLNITYVNKAGDPVFEPAPIQRQYNVVINDPRDIRKAIPDAQIYTEPSVDMSVRLIEPTVYNLRHTKINTVYQTVTVTQAIHAITQSFDIERLHLVPSDNTHVYDHIDVGSYQGISSVYGYLQSVCGVYQKGINAYFTDDVLYIYPPFETDPEYDKSVIFYQVDTGRYTGNHVFHRIQNGNVSIVVNSQPQSYDLSIAGAENVGTGFIFNRASRMSDGFTAIDNNQGAMFTQEPSLSISLANSRTVTGGRNNMFQIHGTDNPFPAMSEIIAHQASLMEVQWMNADPFQIDPCQKIAYYYDRNGAMIKKTGILEKAYYRISKTERATAKDQFGCVGLLTLRLSPNETQEL